MTTPIPTIHLNGSHPESLLAEAEIALRAVGSAIEAMCDAGPNSRDYYVQGPDAAQQAHNAHQRRVKSLRDVQGELREIFEGISDQIAARDAARKAR